MTAANISHKLCLLLFNMQHYVVFVVCYSNSEDLESNLMVEDVYDILAALSVTVKGRTAMCAERTVSALCQAVVNLCYCMCSLLLVLLLSVYGRCYCL